jgi:hypothetical protein
MIKSISFYFLLAVVPGFVFAEDTAITATAAEQEMPAPEVIRQDRRKNQRWVRIPSGYCLVKVN